ncbi:MAG: Gfo/Idh/MocA family oxidoreductase [Verrucomicrobia bacterium]|nr:Gfo/Idh/MocA family oxidoreductase [Verrucomicrobiota bacterium]
MNNRSKAESRPERGLPSRRTFLKQASAAAVGTGMAADLDLSRSAYAAGSDEIKLGLVGCGGRGTGAAAQALTADKGTRLVAMGDVFSDRLNLSFNSLREQPEVGQRVDVASTRQFVGFDAYQQVIASGVDLVLLATPPHFRPVHLRAAIDAGKHVFAEKPVAVDPTGVRSVLESTELARKKDVAILSGLNNRYSPRAQELVRRVHDGVIGEILALHTARYLGSIWVKPRQAGMTEMEYQMRNWYYFTWLSGDFNVEQFVHQLDFMAWLMKDQYPVSCYATGGRQARTGPEYGHIYDHFSSVFEYANGVRLFSTTRQQQGCSPVFTSVAVGTKGQASISSRNAGITGAHPWQAPPQDRAENSHQLEHDAFFAALRKGRIINNGEYMAKSSLMAIMERMSAYTGQTLTWEQVMNSKVDLKPSSYDWNGTPPPAEVAVPGMTKMG